MGGISRRCDVAENELQKGTIDIALGELNNRPPDHAGPTGRLTRLLDVEINQYAGQGAEKKIVADPRRAFSSLSDELRNSGTGLVEAGTWANPTFLRALGDQLLSICTNRPRVWNGTAWTNYGSTRVVNQKLSQSVLHATNGTIATSDHAWISGVTCSVWTEQTYLQDGADVILNTTGYVGIRSDDGAWLLTPTVLLTASGDDSEYQLVKVVQNGSQFWVFYNGEFSGSKINVHVYDTHGALAASTIVPRIWATSPGDNLGVEITRFTEASGTITPEVSHLPAANCQGQVAWLTNDLLGTSVYLA